MKKLKENLSEASTKTYEGSCMALILWLLENKIHLIPNTFEEEVRRHASDKEAFIKSTIFRNLKVPPIRFDKFTGHDFVAWLSTLKRQNGEWWTYSAYTNHRSGLYHLHMNYEAEVTEGFRQTVDDFFRLLPMQKHDTAVNITEQKKSDGLNSPSRQVSPIPPPSQTTMSTTSSSPGEQDTLCNEIVKDVLINIKKSEWGGVSFQELRSSLKNQWKEKLNIPNGEFKELWKRVKKEVQDHLDNNPWADLWMPTYKCTEDPDEDEFAWYRGH